LQKSTTPEAPAPPDAPVSTCSTNELSFEPSPSSPPSQLARKKPKEAMRRIPANIFLFVWIMSISLAQVRCRRPSTAIAVPPPTRLTHMFSTRLRPIATENTAVGAI
jgi:hypothetical protein